MQKVMIVILLGVFLAVHSFGEGFFTHNNDSYVPLNDQQLAPAGHWVYDSLVMLAFETGITTMAVSAPLSMAELRNCLDDIPYNDLSPQGQQEFRRITDYMNEKWLGFSSKNVSVGAAPSINPEAFIKTDKDADWFYDFYQRSPLIDLPLRLSAANMLSVETDLYLGQNYWTITKHDTRTNIPLAANQIDANFPKRSSASAGNSFFNLQIGMGELDIGRSQTGNLLLSQYMTGASYAQLSVFSPRIRFSTNIVEMNVNKYLYLHRLELRPLKRVSITLIEGVMVNAPLELRYLNPASIFHGMAAWRDYADYNSAQANGEDYESNDSRVGSVFGINIDVNPWKYIRLYGQFAMNQFQTSFERENYSESASTIPNALAFLGGLESWIPLAEKGYLYLGAEGLYTSPWMYILSGKGWSFYRSRRELVSPDTTTDIHNWTGSPFGPDAIAVQAKIGWKVPGTYAVYAGWRMWIHGQIDFSVFEDKKDYEYYPSSKEEAEKSTPTGTAVYDNRFFVMGDWDALPWLNLGSTVSAAWIVNDEHISGAEAFSLEFALNATIRLY
jgi:hypothetical protein